jgi:positive regulator of sigma E activity
MKANYKKSFLGSILAFILGTSCCWLTSLAVWLGGATILTAFATFVGRFNTSIIIFAILLLVLGVIQLWTHRRKLRKQN